MLARSFMETITNFCYVGVCDEKEYRAFLLHPIYKHYHNVGTPKMEEHLDSDRLVESALEFNAIRKEKQKKLKKVPIVREALTIFSETKKNLRWTKKNLEQRITVLEKWGKFMDCIFTINKLEYYSDASEALHGSLYGCTYSVGAFDPEFDHTSEEELRKKLYKDNTCILLHLGTLIHASLTLISYSNSIHEIYGHSYNNRTAALNLLMHIIKKKT